MSENADKFFNLKYIAYCWAQLPPEGTDSTFEDFVKYAKFNLSVDKHVLMEDPIWDKYNDEQILVEYFANLFIKSKGERERFEAQFAGSDPDFNDWSDQQIAKNQEEMAEKAASLEDSIKFVPETLGE
jgi:hypothetical protein